jgi:hypothetical protein
LVPIFPAVLTWVKTLKPIFTQNENSWISMWKLY